MPLGHVPQAYNDILESAALAHLATIDAQGRPQVNPVWFIWDAERVLIGVLDKSQKLENVRRAPHVALSILDRAEQGRYLEIRGEVVSIELHHDVEFFNRLARKYTGADLADAAAAILRYKLEIRVDSWTAQG